MLLPPSRHSFGWQWNGNCENFADARVLLSPTEMHDPASDRSLSLFPEVASLFGLLAKVGIPIGIASSSSATEVARRLLRSFGLASKIAHAEVHAGRKEPHLRAIASKLRVPLNRTIFFDDLPHNIRDAERLGCTSVRVNNGLTANDMRCGLQRLGERGRGSALMSSWLRAAPPAPAQPAFVGEPSRSPKAAAAEAADPLVDAAAPTPGSSSEAGGSELGSASGGENRGRDEVVDAGEVARLEAIEAERVRLAALKTRLLERQREQLAAKRQKLREQEAAKRQQVREQEAEESAARGDEPPLTST